MKKIFLYSAIVILLISAISCMILKHKFESDFSLTQSTKLNVLMTNLDESNPDQKAKIGQIASDYKYKIYTYNILAFTTFAGSLLLMIRRKKILKEDN